MASFRPPFVAKGRWDADPEEAADRGTRNEHLTLLEGDEAHRRRIDLVRAIEGEVIPRLVMAHRDSQDRRRQRESAIVDLDDRTVEELTRIVLLEDDDTAWGYVQALRSQGASYESLFLDLLAPTARRLGDLWVADVCDFTEVTIGLGRLQSVLRRLSLSARERAVDRQEPGRRALLAAAPGEQHTFGVLMVAEFMRRGGWDVAGEPGLSSADIVDMVAREWFAVVGLSLYSDRSVDVVAGCIKSIRRASRNRSIGILVGGRVFAEHPELTPLVGADATAADAPRAAIQADNLLALLPMRGGAGAGDGG